MCMLRIPGAISDYVREHYKRQRVTMSAPVCDTFDFVESRTFL